MSAVVPVCGLHGLAFPREHVDQVDQVDQVERRQVTVEGGVAAEAVSDPDIGMVVCLASGVKEPQEVVREAVFAR